MNKAIQQRINEAILQMRISNRSGSHENCIRLSPQSKGKHNDKIIELCKEYLGTGVKFYTEAIFHNGSRADIFLPALNECIEVLNTETDERFSQKIKKYPEAFKIVRVRI